MMKMELPRKREGERPKERRFMSVVKGNMKAVSVTGEDVEDGERWKLMIRCGDL